MKNIEDLLKKSESFSLSLGEVSLTPCHSNLVEVLWHLLDLGVEMFLNFLYEPSIAGRNKVDGSTLSSVPTCSSYSVNVVLLLEGELVVDNESNLLDVNASSQEIGGDENSCGASSEFLHDHVSLELVHLSMHG